jgi:nucleotide-binding universal stress UspA family protein
MFKRILVPLDGSKLAEEALPYAETLAEKFEAELILVRVLQLLPEVISAGPRGGMVFHKQTVQDRQEATTYLNEMAAQVRKVGVLSLRQVVLDAPSVTNAITELAGEESVDLIVMSTHGRSGFSRLVFGSVAGQVLHDAPCPVFLVKAKES